MNQNVKGGFSYKAEWDSTPGNPGNKTATSKVGSESVVITRPDGPGVFESVLNKYNLTGDYVTKQFKLDASENYAWLNVGDDYYLTKWFIRINGDGKKQALTNPVVSDKNPSSSSRLLKKSLLLLLLTTLQMNSLWELT